MIYSTLEEAMLAMGQDYQGLKPQQKEQYTFHEEQVAKYGLYDPGILANGAHYGDQSPFAEEGLICGNCVYYEQGACEIVSGPINANGICKFWIIPESTINQYTAPQNDQTKQIQQLLMDGLSNQEIMAKMPGITVEDIVGAAAEAARTN